MCTCAHDSARLSTCCVFLRHEAWKYTCSLATSLANVPPMFGKKYRRATLPGATIVEDVFGEADAICQDPPCGQGVEGELGKGYALFHPDNEDEARRGLPDVCWRLAGVIAQRTWALLLEYRPDGEGHVVVRHHQRIHGLLTCLPTHHHACRGGARAKGDRHTQRAAMRHACFQAYSGP